MQFFKDGDGSHAANVRLYDPRVIDLGVKVGARTPDTHNAEVERESGVRCTSTTSTPLRTHTNFRCPQTSAAGAPRAARPASQPSASEAAPASGSGGLGVAYRSFSRFVSLIGGADSVKPKPRPIAWLMRHVEEIFDSRYAKDTAELRGEVDAADAAEGSSATPFPTFVVDFFSKRYGLRSLIDQTCWDLLASVGALRRSHMEVEVFARFLEESFDPDDLLFFLYVRSVVQKELGATFRSRWTEMGRSAGEGGWGHPRDMACQRWISYTHPRGMLLPMSISLAGSNTSDSSGSPGSKGAGGPSPLFLTFREVQLVSRVVFGSETVRGAGA